MVDVTKVSLWLQRMIHDSPARESLCEDLERWQGMAYRESSRHLAAGDVNKALVASGRAEAYGDFIMRIKRYFQEEETYAAFQKEVKGGTNA